MAQTVKNLPEMWETWVQSLGQEDPLKKGMATTPVSLPGESHGQRSLVSCSPQDHESGLILSVSFIAGELMLLNLGLASGQT